MTQCIRCNSEMTYRPDGRPRCNECSKNRSLYKLGRILEPPKSIKPPSICKCGCQKVRNKHARSICPACTNRYKSESRDRAKLFQLKKSAEFVAPEPQPWRDYLGIHSKFTLHELTATYQSMARGCDGDSKFMSVLIGHFMAAKLWLDLQALGIERCAA